MGLFTVMCPKDAHWKTNSVDPDQSLNYLNQLMRLWYLSHKPPAKAQASLRIHTFTYIQCGSKRKVWPNFRNLAPLDCCPYAFEEWVYGGQKVPYLMTWLICPDLSVWIFIYLNHYSKVQIHLTVIFCGYFGVSDGQIQNMSCLMTKQQNDYAPSKDSDQPGHQPSLISLGISPVWSESSQCA